LNNDTWYSTSIITGEEAKEKSGGSEAQKYLKSKLKWTAEASVAFCKELQTDYCKAEGGAAGLNARPSYVATGFAAITVTGK